MATKIVEVKSVKLDRYNYCEIIVKDFLFGRINSFKLQFLNANKEILHAGSFEFNLNSFNGYLSKQTGKILTHFIKRLPIIRNDTIIGGSIYFGHKNILNQIIDLIKYIQFEETQDIIEESALAKEKITEYRLANKKEKSVKQEVFTDMYDQVINIGDKVLISDARYMGLKEATVIEFTNKNLKVLLPNNETKIQMDGQCFKIPKNKEEFDILNTTLTLNALKK